MSNNVVGNVYQSVIDEVINASRVDFEEGGVDEAVLEELKKGWQQKLSQLEVATFPWDPKPEPPAPAPAAPPPAQPAQDSLIQPTYSQAELSPQPPLAGIALPGGHADVQVKQEPGIKAEPNAPNYHPAPAGSDFAQQRALSHIQQKYGDAAASNIGQSQAAGAGQRAQQPPQSIALPQQQYRPQPNAQQQQQQQQQYPNQPQPGMRNSQVDGAGDGDDSDDAEDIQGVLMQRDAAGTLHELGRVDLDRMMHRQFLSNAKAMEGGGLMLPLKEATKTRTASSRKGKARAGGVAQYDGEDDDDVADEDAINSDLDDSDEDKDEEEVDDEGLGHIMLCMYDKVQRVKNKWKCVLKDGVLTVNGKEYVFHKATGEYEW